MDQPNPDRVLKFPAAGMWWEVTHTTAETGGERYEAINVLSADFAGPPLHLHPTAEESYSVVSGRLDVCVGHAWRTVGPGETAVVPAGVPHTVRNTSGAEVRLVNVHKPALDFERFFHRLHALVNTHGVTLPPKGLRAVVLISMLFTDHPNEIASVRPPRFVVRAFARLGRLLGYKLPQ